MDSSSNRLYNLYSTLLYEGYSKIHTVNQMYKYTHKIKGAGCLVS